MSEDEIKSTREVSLYDPEKIGFFKRLEQLRDSFPDPSKYGSLSEVKKIHHDPCGYTALAFIFGTDRINYDSIDRPIREAKLMDLLRAAASESGVTIEELNGTEGLKEKVDADNFLAIVMIAPTEKKHLGEEMKHASLIVEDGERLHHVKHVSL